MICIEEGVISTINRFGWADLKQALVAPLLIEDTYKHPKLRRHVEDSKLYRMAGRRNRAAPPSSGREKDKHGKKTGDD